MRVCVYSGEHGDDEGEEEAAEHRSDEDEEDADDDAVQQDRRASHAKASTRNIDEQMPDAAHDAGVFACSACCNMLHLLGMSEHALTLCIKTRRECSRKCIYRLPQLMHVLLHSLSAFTHAVARHAHNQLNHQSP